MAKKSLDEIFGLKQPEPKFSFGKAITNIPGSAFELGKDVFGLVRHPIQALKGISDIGEGALRTGAEKVTGKDLFKGDTRQEQAFRQVGDFFKERYGGTDEILKTIETDPVGFAGDLAAIFGFGGAALKVGGRLTKTGEAGALARAGSRLSRTAEVVEPLGIAGRAVSKTAGVAGEIGKAVLGTASGVGSDVIELAVKNVGGDFRSALKGESNVNDILSTAHKGVKELTKERGAKYQADLANIQGFSTKVLDFTPVRNKISSTLEKFKITRKADNTLDFSKSAIADTAEAKRISDFINELENWDDFTAQGLDTLKQRFTDFDTTSNQGTAMLTDIQSEVRGLLEKNVEGYAELTANYKQASDTLNDIRRSLSLKDGTAADTTINKLASSLRQNNEFRLDLLNRLDEVTGTNITGLLAGRALNPVVAQGLVGKSAQIGAAGTAAITGFSPATIVGLAMTSPRIVGEFLTAFGYSKKVVDFVVKQLDNSGAWDTSTRIGATQAGRVVEEGQRKSLEEIFLR